MEHQNYLFPIFLKLNELETLIVGGGNIALEKITAIISNSPLAKVTIVAPEIKRELLEISDNHTSITLLEREFEEKDLDGKDIVIIATADPVLNQDVKRLAQKAKVLANVVDTPAICDFYLGSIVKKGHLKIAISTNGKSPTIAKRLKGILDAAIPVEINYSISNLGLIRNSLKGDLTEKIKRLNKITSVLAQPESSRRSWFNGRFKISLNLHLLVLSMVISSQTNAQSNDQILNLLISQKLIKQEVADSLRAEAALKQAEQKEKQTIYPVNAGKPIIIGGYLQTRYQSFQESGKPSGLDVRRARLDIKGNINPTWDYKLQLEFAGSPKILDAYATYKSYDYLKITIGQFKIPLSAENLASSNKLETIERSQVVEALTARNKDVIGNQNGRDIGLQAGGSILKSNEGNYILDYSVGIFNGSGINLSDNNHAKDIAGRIVIHPTSGLDIGACFYQGNDKWGDPLKQSLRNRAGADLAYTYRSFSFKSEYLIGKDGLIDRKGGYAQMGYFVLPKKLQLLAKYDVYDPNTNVTSDKDQSTYYIGGVNYLFNEGAKLQVNYTKKKEQGVEIKNDLISAQFQIQF